MLYDERNFNGDDMGEQRQRQNTDFFGLNLNAAAGDPLFEPPPRSPGASPNLFDVFHDPNVQDVPMGREVVGGERVRFAQQPVVPAAFWEGEMGNDDDDDDVRFQGIPYRFEDHIRNPEFLQNLEQTPEALASFIQQLSLADCEILVHQCRRPGVGLEPPNPDLLRILTPPSQALCRHTQENILHCAARNMSRYPGEKKTWPSDTVYAQLHNMLRDELVHLRPKHERTSIYDFYRCIVMQPNQFQESTLGVAICASHNFHTGDRLVEQFIYETYAMPKETKTRGRPKQICWTDITKLVSGSTRRQSPLEIAAMIGAFDIFCKYINLYTLFQAFVRGMAVDPNVLAEIDSDLPSCLASSNFPIPPQNIEPVCGRQFVRGTTSCNQNEQRRVAEEDLLKNQEAIRRMQDLYNFYNNGQAGNQPIRAQNTIDETIRRNHQLSHFISVHKAAANAIHMNHASFLLNLIQYRKLYELDDIFGVERKITNPIFYTRRGQGSHLFTEKKLADLRRRLLALHDRLSPLYENEDEDIIKMFVLVLVQPSNSQQMDAFFRNPIQEMKNIVCNDRRNRETEFCYDLAIASRANGNTLANDLMALKNVEDNVGLSRRQLVPWQCNEHQRTIFKTLANSVFADRREDVILMLLFLDLLGGLPPNANNFSAEFRQFLGGNSNVVVPDDLLEQIPLQTLCLGRRSIINNVPVFFFLLGGTQGQRWVQTYKRLYLAEIDANNLPNTEKMYRIPLVPYISPGREESMGPIVWQAVLCGRMDILDRCFRILAAAAAAEEVDDDVRNAHAICLLFFLKPDARGNIAVQAGEGEALAGREATYSLLWAALRAGQWKTFCFLLVWLMQVPQWNQLPPSTANRNDLGRNAFFDPRGLVPELINYGRGGNNDNIELQVFFFAFYVANWRVLRREAQYPGEYYFYQGFPAVSFMDQQIPPIFRAFLDRAILNLQDDEMLVQYRARNILDELQQERLDLNGIAPRIQVFLQGLEVMAE